MQKRINDLETLGNAIREGESFETSYDLGEGRERTDLLVTLVKGETEQPETYRIETTPQIRLYEEEGKLILDITDSDEGKTPYFEGLRPNGKVELEGPNPDYQGYDLGTLIVDIGDDRQLAICQTQRPERN